MKLVNVSLIKVNERAIKSMHRYLFRRYKAYMAAIKKLL